MHRRAVRHDNARFGTSQFHVMSMMKVQGVLEVLKLGYHVILIDADIALIEDPLPHLLWNNIDYVHSVNQICNP